MTAHFVKRFFGALFLAIVLASACSSQSAETPTEDLVANLDGEGEDNINDAEKFDLEVEDSQGLPDQAANDGTLQDTDDDGADSIDTQNGPPALNGEITATVLRTIDVEVEGVVVQSLLLRLESPGASPTYAQWVERQGVEGKAPVVVQTMPYDVIDWTGEAVDTVAAGAGNALSPEDYIDQTFLYLLHNYHVLAIYGRFYTEESIENDVVDMLQGLAWLAQEENADTDNIAIWGASWGGFEALYGAAFAPDGVRPKVGAALAPLGDFAIQTRFWTDFVDVEITDAAKKQEHENFRAPYLTRIYKTTGGHPDDPGTHYENWTAEAVAQAIDMPFFIAHDTWDTLVPYEGSATLASLNDLVDLMRIEHDDEPDWNQLPLDHGLLMGDFSLPVAWTFMTSYVIHGIARPGQAINLIFQPAAIRNLLQMVHDKNESNQPIDWAPERLLELAGSTVTLFDVDQLLPPVPGAQWMTEQCSQIWGKELTPESIEQWIAEGML